jgi:hypothetical protein
MVNFHPNQPSNASRLWITIVIGVLICVVAFAAGVFVTKLFNADVAVNGVALEDETPSVTTQDQIVEPGSLAIEWISPEDQQQTTVDPTLFNVLCQPQVVDKDSFDEAGGTLQSTCVSYLNGVANPVPDAKAYQLGIVRGGEYDGRYLEMHTFAQEGMGTYWVSFYLLRAPFDPSGQSAVTKSVLLDQYMRMTNNYGLSNDTDTGFLGATTQLDQLAGLEIDSITKIGQLEIEHRLVDTNGRCFRLTGTGGRYDSQSAIGLDHYKDSTSLESGEKMFLYNQENEDGTLVVPDATSTGSTQFYLIDNDGRVLWYSLEIPFWNYEGEDIGQQNPPSIKWNDGTMNSGVYFSGRVGGCGFVRATNVLSQKQIDDLPDMVRVGTGVGADGSQTPIFEPSTYDDVYYTEGFNALSTQFQQFNEEKKTFADLSHPYLYFQDSFGRWVELMSNEIIPPVECGKPVIYLYPEKPVDLTVTLNPKGGFSYTEPEYGTGWNVTAYPDGHVVNRKDGEVYPYLFWEGRGGLYEAPSTYWVVERVEVERFLGETLFAMGLIEHEVSDFIEFWLPRMQGSPYYKIGFHDTRIMDELAPLSLSVKPDHVFRILMDYEPLVARELSQPPRIIPRADRDGFEVIEWGGVVR